jgi:ribonuclease HII
MLPARAVIRGADDSKLLTPGRRTKLDSAIRRRALAVAIGSASPRFIDRHNIRQATFAAMRLAVGRLRPAPELVLSDGEMLPGLAVECRGVIGGDSRSLTIACASIIAKVYRDRLMQRLATRFPGYGLEKNFGYGTPLHLKAVADIGPSPIHRRSFAPVRQTVLVLGA